MYPRRAILAAILVAPGVVGHRLALLRRSTTTGQDHRGDPNQATDQANPGQAGEHSGREQRRQGVDAGVGMNPVQGEIRSAPA